MPFLMPHVKWEQFNKLSFNDRCRWMIDTWTTCYRQYKGRERWHYVRCDFRIVPRPDRQQYNSGKDTLEWRLHKRAENAVISDYWLRGTAVRNWIDDLIDLFNLNGHSGYVSIMFDPVIMRCQAYDGSGVSFAENLISLVEEEAAQQGIFDRLSGRQMCNPGSYPHEYLYRPL
jgi:hypothetical protein